VHAGSVANAIPGTGQIVGTLRALDVSGWQRAKQLIPQLAADIVRPFGVEVAVVGHRRRTSGGQSRLRHPALIRARERVLGPNGVASTEQSLGGEDFSWMLQQVPGALARLGVRTPGQPCPDIHQPDLPGRRGLHRVGLKVLAEVATTVSADPPVARRVPE
jgi:amidohydrolase